MRALPGNDQQDVQFADGDTSLLLSSAGRYYLVEHKRLELDTKGCCNVSQGGTTGMLHFRRLCTVTFSRPFSHIQSFQTTYLVGPSRDEGKLDNRPLFTLSRMVRRQF
jgi:hypothetical protein